MAKTKPRDRILDALMSLAAEQPWEKVSLEAIADRAGVTLAALRAEYDGRIAVLSDYVRSVDEKVLSGRDAELATEAPRERLFDLLFARFEVHAPYRQAIRNLARSARKDLVLACEINRIMARSMVWMLAASGIPAEGARGMVRAQALALIWARVLRVWFTDDDPGLAKTMAALDRHLRDAEQAAKRIDWLKSCLKPKSRPRKAEPSVPDGVDMPEGHPT